MRGRDLAAERTRARLLLNEVAAALSMSRTALSFIENEHTPTNAEFNARYMAVVRELQAERETAGAA